MADLISMIVARVKKILNIDEDTHQVSNNAAFVITIATVSIKSNQSLSLSVSDNLRKCSYGI